MGTIRAISEALTVVIRLMVEHPEEVTLQITSNDDAFAFRVSVSKMDVGFLIGKQGNTARSLRTLLGAMASTAKLKITLDIDMND